MYYALIPLRAEGLTQIVGIKKLLRGMRDKVQKEVKEKLSGFLSEPQTASARALSESGSSFAKVQSRSKQTMF